VGLIQVTEGGKPEAIFRAGNDKNHILDFQKLSEM
jgi:hypothetical protein